MKSLRRTLCGCSLLLFCWIVPLLSSTHKCPVSSHYPFSCSACLSFSDQNATQSAAAQDCSKQGGELVTLRDDTEWRILQLYLESLNLSDFAMWVGYRLGERGELSGEEWTGAPGAVVESIQRSLSLKGSEAGECVTVRGGELVNTACLEDYRYICIFSHPAPSLAHSYPRPGSVYHPSSQTLSLEAFISGSGLTDLEWRRDGSPLAPSSTVEMRTRHDNTWAMLNVTSGAGEGEGYRGFYELLVTNPAGRTVVATWTVEPPTLGSFRHIPRDLTIPEGSIAFFECSMADAKPTPTYTWYKGDDPVIPDKTRVFVSNVTHTLLIRGAEPGDEGSYRCRVENSAGVMFSSSASLTLKPQQDFAGSENQFLLHPRNLTLLEGESYSMECVALHTTTNYFYVMIMRPDAWTFYYPTNVGTPVITRESVSLHENGEGEVVCQAASISSQQLTPSQPGYLTVHTRPHVNPLSTDIGNGSGPHSIHHTTTNLGIECSFGGVPSPVQTWYHDGTAVISEEEEEGVSSGGESEGESESSRRLELLQPVSGVYQCHVSSQYGVAISSAVFCAQSLPGPTPFSVQADTTTSLLVSWSSPVPLSSHPLLLRYQIITTHTLTNDTLSSSTLLPHQSPWVVKGLNIGSEYRVRVMSWSPLGQGEVGLEGTMFTYGPAPQRSPLNFLDVTVSRTYQNRGLVVQWSLIQSLPPATVLAYYQVEYRMTGEGREVGVAQVDASQSWIFVDKLENAQNYEIRLRMGVRVRRAPPEFDHTPWSRWMAVQGVTTPPPVTSSSVPTASPSVGPAESGESDNREEVLLVAVLVPLLSVLLLVALLVPITVGGWRFWAKRRAASYNPSRMERRRIQGKQIPMGKEVFNMPELTAAVLAAEEEEAAYCTMSTLRTVTTTTSTSRPSSQSEELTADSPVMHSSNVE